MSKTIEVSQDAWRKLKIMSAQMDKPMKEVAEIIVGKSWEEYEEIEEAEEDEQ
nr:hypothetical protein [uncultured archaeon]